MQYIISLIAFVAVQATSFYSLTIQDSNGNSISFSGFEGKKVLFVNTASNSADTAQFIQLEQLYQANKDSLVVIAVPSNDFHHENVPDSLMFQSLHARFGVNFIVSQTMTVKDSSSTSALYQWLTKQSLNGAADSKVNKDFYKYLVNKNGQLIGIFSASETPMDSTITEAIKL